jgi:hypothetical protein
MESASKFEKGEMAKEAFEKIKREEKDAENK